MATTVVDEMIEMENYESSVQGVKDTYITATLAADENTETDELKTSNTEGSQEQPGTAPDDTPKKIACCLRSPCYKLCTTGPTMEFTITKMDFIFALFSLCIYMADIGTDIWVAVIHYQNNDIWWMAMTLAFVFAPCLTLGIWFFIKDHDDCKAILETLTISIPGGLTYFFITDLVKEWKIIIEKDPQEKKRKSAEILDELQGSSFSRLFEAFLEAAPQLILQLYIIYINEEGQGHIGVVQWCSVWISLASLSLPVTTEYKMKRLDDGKYKVSVPGTALLLAFHIFTMGARVLSLAVLAVFSGSALTGVTLTHFVIMYIWLLLIITNKLSDLELEKLEIVFVYAFIYIFCFIDYTPGFTRLRYAFYYTLTYMENIGMLLLWYFATQSILEWQRYLACILIIGGYLIGILCLVVYYVDLHPNNLNNDPKKEIKVLVPFSKCQLIQYREECEEGCPCCLCCK